MRFLQPDGSTAFTLDDNYRRKANKAFIADGSITVNLQNGQRRSASIDLDNVNDQYEYAYNKMWFGQEIAIDEGVILPNGEPYYIPQGVFLLTNPESAVTPSGKTASYNLVDKWANLDGSLYGVLDGTYLINVGSNIFTAIASLLLEDKGNGRVLDPIAPVFTNYYNGITTTLPNGSTTYYINAPYDLEVSAGGTLADVVIGLCSMVAAWVGYDAYGALRIDPSQDDISDATKPILWTFSQEEAQLLGMSYSAKNTDVYNDVMIVGDQLDDYAQPSARARNYDPKSDTNINLIGRKTFREEKSGYGTALQCRDYATWKLKRTSVLQKSVQISCSQVLHLQENSLVEIVRTDRKTRASERHLIQGFSRPLVGNKEMTIDAISVNDFPDITVTVS